MPDETNVVKTDGKVEEIDTPAPKDEPEAKVETKPEAKLEVVHEPETPKQPEPFAMTYFVDEPNSPEPNFELNLPDVNIFPD